MLTQPALGIDVAELLESESEAIGLRKLVLADAEGIEEPARRSALLADPDVRGLFGRDVEMLVEEPGMRTT